MFILEDSFWKMSKKDARVTLDIYQLFVKETEALITLYDMGSITHQSIHFMIHILCREVVCEQLARNLSR